MTPEQVTAWVQVAQLATGAIGVGIGVVKQWIADAHPSADPAALAQLYARIDADDVVRENLARQMAGG